MKLNKYVRLGLLSLSGVLMLTALSGCRKVSSADLEGYTPYRKTTTEVFHSNNLSKLKVVTGQSGNLSGSMKSSGILV